LDGVRPFLDKKICYVFPYCNNLKKINQSIDTLFQEQAHIHRVREKTAPLNKMLQNAEYITQCIDTYTA